MSYQSNQKGAGVLGGELVLKAHEDGMSYTYKYMCIYINQH